MEGKHGIGQSPPLRGWRVRSSRSVVDGSAQNLSALGERVRASSEAGAEKDHQDGRAPPGNLFDRAFTIQGRRAALRWWPARASSLGDLFLRDDEPGLPVLMMMGERVAIAVATQHHSRQEDISPADDPHRFFQRIDHQRISLREVDGLADRHQWCLREGENESVSPHECADDASLDVGNGFLRTLLSGAASVDRECDGGSTNGHQE